MNANDVSEYDIQDAISYLPILYLKRFLKFSDKDKKEIVANWRNIDDKHLTQWDAAQKAVLDLVSMM